MGGGGDGGKVLGHVGPSRSNSNHNGGGGHRQHSSKHGGGGHHNSPAAGAASAADNAAATELQGSAYATKSGSGGSRNNAAAGGGGGGTAGRPVSSGGKAKSSKAIVKPLTKPGGSADFRAPRAQDLAPTERDHEEERGGVCMSILCYLFRCGWRGARLAPIHVALDEEAEELVEGLRVSKAQLAKLEGIFENIDVSKTGTVYCSEILSVVDMAQSPFTDTLFKLVGVHPDGWLTFSQLCRILMTYCVFSKEEILLFLFRQYDTDGSGTIDEREFRELAKTVNSASPMFPGNFAKALLDFDTNADGLIDFDEFRVMDKAFPLLFFPAFRLQDSLQKHFLGSSFWLKIQEGVLAREAIAGYQATHGGMAPEKRGRGR